MIDPELNLGLSCFGGDIVKDSVSIEEFKKAMKSGDEIVILDIRTRGELLTVPMIESSIHIPLSQLEDEAYSLPGEVPIYIICARGRRALTAAEILKSEGKTPVVVRGGIIAYYDSLK